MDTQAERMRFNARIAEIAEFLNDRRKILSRIREGASKDALLVGGILQAEKILKEASRNVSGLRVSPFAVGHRENPDEVFKKSK